jgi:flagella basal body P-ring formation protein FlgA
LPGEVTFSDFRLPSPVFLAHQAQELELEPPALPAPGRLSLRYSVREVDGGVARRLTGSVFVDCWAVVPCVSIPVNKGEVLSPEHITFVRKNLAYLRDAPWDGRGGPWQALRPISVDQPILLSDLTYVPTIKKGSVVKLVFESNSVRLSATVEALADGVSGETIPVRNLQSKRQVYAMVFDAETVMAISGTMRSRRADISRETPETSLPAQAGR